MLKKLLIVVVVVLVSAPVYAQSVDTAWVRRYNGPANSQDSKPAAIAVDGSGNVYVTGETWSGVGYEYATIKYYPNGDTAWVRTYPGWPNDRATSLAVDGSGNVYVTGYISTGTWEDYTTIKYNSSGTQLWVKSYNGPGNGNDYAEAIAVDGSGNVYVTGGSQGSGTGSTFDYATVKYGPSGNQLWVTRYSGPGDGTDFAHAIKVDGSGNVYVTGQSDDTTYGHPDYATIKYSPSGNQLWVKRYNGPGNSNDYAEAMVLDGSGNIYVTGYILDSLPAAEYATIKYDPAGNQLWLKRYIGPGHGDQASAIALDHSGDIYVTGTSCGSYGSITSADYATVKYDSAGNQLWVQRYNGPENSLDSPSAIALDDSGNVYVTGGSADSMGYPYHYDYATVAYDPAGNQLWVKRFNGPGNGDNQALGIAVDKSANAYVTGYITDSLGYAEYATIKYSQSLCGDANGDGKITVSDVIYMINYLFKGGPQPSSLRAGDVNCDGQKTVSDVIYAVNYLFKGGPKPCQACP